MLYGAANFKQDLKTWLKWVKEVRHDDWCGGGAVCNQRQSVCSGLDKTSCKDMKSTCVFGKKKLFGSCKPKTRYEHSCANYKTKMACEAVKKREGLCKFYNNVCSHVCINLMKKHCVKFRNTKDNMETCKHTKDKNPCKGCQTKTTCG